MDEKSNGSTDISRIRYKSKKKGNVSRNAFHFIIDKQDDSRIYLQNREKKAMKKCKSPL